MQQRFGLFLVAVIACFNVLYSQDDYIGKHKFCWSRKDSLVKIDLIKDDLKNNKMLLIGEAHDTNGNNKFESDLLKNAIQNDYRVLLLELPFSLSPLIQDYIDSGDDELYNYLKKVYFENIPFFLKIIHEINKDIPSDKKLIVRGIDIDFSYRIGFKNLCLLLNRKGKKAESTKKLIRQLNFRIRLCVNYRGFLQKLEKKVQKDSVFVSNTGISQENLLTIIEGMRIKVRSISTNLDTINLKTREVYMYNNARSILNKYQNEKCVGIFGSFHVTRITTENWMSKKKYTTFTAMLNTYNDSPVKNSIISITSEYPKFLDWWTYPEPKEMVDSLLQNICSDFTLYKIDGKDSPYSEVAKIVQYILINNIDPWRYWSIRHGWNDPKNKE
jgi:hypothetical protein